MNLSKSFEFFDPSKLSGRIHIIGCGSVGSTVAELLARFGIDNFVLYDFDIVEPHNIVNQMFTTKHLFRPKTECLSEMLKEINPDVKIKVEAAGWTDQPLDGYVFLAVDNIELRKEIAEKNKYNTYVKAMFDFRTGLTDAQHYAADWADMKSKKAFLDTMQFSHDEAKSTEHLSACQVSMCVAPTVRLIANVGVTNFINFVKGEHLYRQIPIDAFQFEVDPIG
jgi:molybdopterin/thiamine biosynthesis adenylyltransferase